MKSVKEVVLTLNKLLSRCLEENLACMHVWLTPSSNELYLSIADLQGQEKCPRKAKKESSFSVKKSGEVAIAS